MNEEARHFLTTLYLFAILFQLAKFFRAGYRYQRTIVVHFHCKREHDFWAFSSPRVVLSPCADQEMKCLTVSNFGGSAIRETYRNREHNSKQDSPC